MPRVIVPVGMALGPRFAFVDPPAAEPECFLVQVCGAEQKLTAAEHRAWAMAHVDPQRHAALQVTRTSLSEYLQTLHSGSTDLPALLERGLLLEFDPAGDDLPDVLGRYRLHPTAEGLGSTPQDPWTYRIGHHGVPAVEVTSGIFALWAYSHTERSLWTACQSLSAAMTETGQSSIELARAVASAVPLLIASSCAVLQPVHDR